MFCSDLVSSESIRFRSAGQCGRATGITSCRSQGPQSTTTQYPVRARSARVSKSRVATRNTGLMKLLYD